METILHHLRKRAKEIYRGLLAAELPLTPFFNVSCEDAFAMQWSKWCSILSVLRGGAIATPWLN